MTAIYAWFAGFWIKAVVAIAVIAVIAVWTYGNRWQAVQALRHTHALEAAAREATNKESQKLAAQAAQKSKESYETDIQSQRLDAKHLDGVLARVYSARTAACAPTNPPGITGPAAPQFEWER